jgi:hypothetical protein
MPAQITVRADEELVERVRQAARQRRRSMNDFVVAVLDAATNPASISDGAERIRERLRNAGLLSETPARRRPRPDRAETARARARAGRGTPLSDIVGTSR